MKDIIAVIFALIGMNIVVIMRSRGKPHPWEDVKADLKLLNIIALLFIVIYFLLPTKYFFN